MHYLKNLNNIVYLVVYRTLLDDVGDQLQPTYHFNGDIGFYFVLWEVDFNEIYNKPLGPILRWI